MHLFVLLLIDLFRFAERLYPAKSLQIKCQYYSVNVIPKRELLYFSWIEQYFDLGG